jgi:predicted CopG family antitoxin
MQKKLTITIDEEIYNKLYSVVGTGKISKFIEELVKPHLVSNSLANSYNLMSRDKEREREANEWIEGLLDDQYN